MIDATEVIVTTPHDERLALSPDHAPCWSEQSDDEPLMVVVGPDATDEKLRRMADRHGLDVGVLFQVRARQRQ